jgi:lipoprotein-anchoring transpeptidase ErfK/SrfK
MKFWLRLIPILSAALVGCWQRHEPPGATKPDARTLTTRAGPTGESADPDDGSEESTRSHTIELGSVADSLPFEPTGLRIASIAWRTWIYTDTGPMRTRYGYLRAGAIVDARGPAIQNDGCAEGWYRINPRGFVCLGKGATLDLSAPAVVQSSVRPTRGHGLPYLYAIAGDNMPAYYFKLPTQKQLVEQEGPDIKQKLMVWRQRISATGLDQLLGEIGPPPDFLASGQELAKPYGTFLRLHNAVTAGRAAGDSGFAIVRVFEWLDRVWGLTTELDLVGLDETKLVRPSEFHGTELGPEETLPVAFIENAIAPRYRVGAAGVLTTEGSYARREPVKLTGERRPGGFWTTRDGFLLQEQGTRIVRPRDSYPSFATGGRKWVDVSIRHQTLVAYVGDKPVYATLVSTGRGGMGDPEKDFATVRGTFMVYSKHVAATMDAEDDKSDSFNLQDVPFVQYFHKGFALHGTYWHDEFGKLRSHGCINLSPIDSAWLFEWTDPPVPKDWHSVLNKERGTVVYIHG